MNAFYELCALTLTDRKEHRPFESNIDWQDIADAADAYLMTQIVFEGIKRSSLNPYTTPNYADLQERSEQDGLNQLHIESQCRDIIRGLYADGAAFVPVGAFLTKMAYPSTQLRFLKELEIYVPDPQEADHTLTRLGYTLKDSFEDRKYFVKDDAITVTVLYEGVSPDAEFADVFNYSKLLHADNCVSTRIFDVPTRIPTQETAIEYLIRQAAQAFLCGGLSPLEVWDILLFAHSFRPDKNKLFAPLRRDGLALFASAVFAIGSEYFSDEFDDYFITSCMITPEITEELCRDTLLANPGWDMWSNRRQFRVPMRYRKNSAAARFFDVLFHNGPAQPLNFDRERLPLLSDLGLV